SYLAPLKSASSPMLIRKIRSVREYVKSRSWRSATAPPRSQTEQRRHGRRTERSSQGSDVSQVHGCELTSRSTTRRLSRAPPPIGADLGVGQQVGLATSMTARASCRRLMP